jgi:hypothetical protein
MTMRFQPRESPDLAAVLPPCDGTTGSRLGPKEA